jgi:microcystin-dependent protein
MARNGSGTMTIPNTLVPGEVITASDHNENYADIAAEITNSVAVDGQSTMTGAFKAASGTAAAPGITFGSDTDSGIYRIGANNLGVGVNGAEVLDVATTGLTVTGDMDATTVKQGGFQLIPAGVLFPYGGAAAPSGYLFAYGQAVSRTTYAALFTAIGTTYGAGDGSTTFTLPDMRGRVAAGSDVMGGVSAGRISTANGFTFTGNSGTGGSETKSLVTANLPAYTPSGSVSSTLNSNIQGVAVVFSSGGVNTPSPGANQAINGAVIVDQSVTSSFTGNAQGGTSTAFSVVQPTIVLNYIIKT